MGSYKKKLFIALLLILLIGFFVCGSVNASMTDLSFTVDQPTLLKDQQEYLAKLFLSSAISNNETNLLNDFKNYLNSGYYPLFVYSRSGNNSYLYCYMIPKAFDFGSFNTSLVDTDDEYFEDTYFLYPISGYSVPATNLNSNGVRRYVMNRWGTTFSYNNYTGTVFIPSVLIYYDNKTCSNFKSGVNPTDNVYLMIMQSIEDNTEQEEETTNELKKLNDFMKSDDVDDDAYDMPGNSDNPTQDITQNGVNNIFDIFYNEINNWESQNITVRIPFTNKFFYIPANLTENIIETNFPAGAFKNLLGLIWYYLLAVYIIKDVQKYIDGLQTGEILTKSDTNIKTEML